jgi:hypothetical protein
MDEPRASDDENTAAARYLVRLIEADYVQVIFAVMD